MKHASLIVTYSAALCKLKVLTFVSDNLGGLEEEAAVLQVHHLSLQTILHHIHQSQFITQVLFTFTVCTQFIWRALSFLS